MKTKLMVGASALTLVMIVPGVAQAAPVGECGVPNTSATPNVASCISDSTDYENGITYNQTDFGTAADLKVDLYGTVVVNATTGTTGVRVQGSPDHDALIGARAGSKITASQTGLQAETTGSGDGVIENHGTVTSGAVGAVAASIGTGTASVLNAADGTVTVSQGAGPGSIIGAGLAITGRNGSAVNQGVVTVNSAANAGQMFGVGGEGLGGGMLALTNSNRISVTTSDADAVGMGSLPSGGNLAIANNAALTVSSGAGSATGLLALGDGTAGTTQLTNTGAFSVTSQSGDAVGMSAAQRGDVAMAATRTSAASTFTVSGANATGFDVEESTTAPGAVSVTGTGQHVQVTASGTATGVSVSGGTTQAVSFTPATVGGTAYSGDVDVSAAGEARGVILGGATDAVSVDFTGARLSVTSTGAGATGIQVAGGSTVHISAVPGSGSAAALAVSAAGGEATGIATSGATGAQDVTLGDVFAVSNTAGSAAGITLADGTAQTVSLAQGATVTASGDALGLSLEGGSGALSVTSTGVLAVDSATGSAAGITFADGTAQTVSLAQGLTVTASGDALGLGLEGGSGELSVTSDGGLAVNSTAGSATGIRIADGSSQNLALGGSLQVEGQGEAYGVWSTDSQGEVSLTASDTVQVVSSGDGATGIYVDGGTDIDVSLAKGLDVQGSAFAGGAFLAGSGDLSLASLQDFTVSAEGSSAIGAYMIGGTSQTARFDGDLSVSGSGFAVGMLQSGGIGAASLAIAGDFTGTGLIAGLVQSDGTVQSIDVGGDFSLSSATGDVLGVVLENAGESASLTVGGTFAVTAADGSAQGVSIAGHDAAVSLARDLTVSGAGAAAGGILASLDGDASVTLGGALSVTNAGGTATGLALESLGAQTVSLSGPVTVSTDGDATGIDLRGDAGAIALTVGDLVSVTSEGGNALGLAIDGGSDQSATLTGGLQVSASGSATGVGLSDGTGTATLHLPAALTVTSTDADATGISATDGAGLTIDGLGAVTVTAATDAAGIRSSGFTGEQNVTLGDVSATATGGSVNGVNLSGSGAITLADAGAITAAGTSGYGVLVQGTGADGAVAVSLASVTTSGEGVQGVSLAQTAAGATGGITASLGSVSTSGADATGVSVQGSQSGAVSLTLGRAAAPAIARAAVSTGGVSTTGDNANGVDFAVIDGAGTLTNLGTISTTGANALGISAVASGTGSIAIDSAAVTTGGAGSDGIVVQTGAGAQTLAVQSIAVTGAGARGLVATSDSGAIVLNGTAVSAKAGDAIVLTSTSGDVSATLASGGATTSGTGAGLVIATGGSADVTLGSNAKLRGATYGLSSDAGAGQDVVLAGTVGADSNHAVALSGGAATLTNNGTIDGYMTFDTAATTLTNAGTWNAHGGNTTFAGNAVLINSGTINVNPAATVAATMRVTGLNTLRNSGTISLVNGHTGDVLDLGGAAFVGSGNSRVVLEANLGASAVGGNAAQSADQLNVGAVTGKTTIVIDDLSGATAAQFNFDGIRLVNAASVASGAFVLEGGAVNKGFVDYQLITDAQGNVDLVGVPSTQAFELVRTGAEVRRYWRRSGDAWSDQMRAFAPQQGTSVWGQFLGGSETNRSRPIYSETVLGTATSFAPNLDVRDSWWGGQFGLDWGHSAGNGGDWGVGLTGGYVSQEGKVRSTGDRIKLDGGNVGLYARYRSADGFFAHGLAKLDRYSLKYDLGNGASAPKTNGTSYGVEVEAGYHVRTGAMFLEPSASASWTNADLDGFAATGGVGAKFDRVQSFYGRAGLRAGIETQSGGWAIQPYVGANWEGEMNGRPGATLSSGGEDLYFRDASEGGRARWEAGVQGSSQGLSAFAKVEGITGSGTSGVAGRAGVSVRW